MKQHMLLGITLLSLGILQGCSSSDDEWMITSEGIGPLNAETLFDYTTLEELLPNLRINQGLGTAEGERFEVMYVYNTDTEKMFTILPSEEVFSADKPADAEQTDADTTVSDPIISTLEKTIHSIEVHSPAYKTTEGFALNSLFSEIYPETGKAKCVPGAEESSGSVICTAPISDHIRFMFRGEGGSTDGSLPANDVLKDWTVERLFWLAQVPPVMVETVAEEESEKKSGS